ncbi:hypothetical protein GCM10009665_47570 [Kitasatospora nipponensis]|uniref:SUKH-3 immunity protein of toxin-antitoxin system n=1 Tax=Kitasatospora nipponensis TaxID=258049 RepID=A0ABN1WM54_9ACTN
MPTTVPPDVPSEPPPAVAPDPPRPLNAAERAVLELLLSADFAGAEALRRQLDHTEVTGAWFPRSLSVDLRVREPALRAGPMARLAPVGAAVVDEQGEYIGEFLLWLEDDGLLGALEYAWVTDDMPTELPPVERIELVG